MPKYTLNQVCRAIDKAKAKLIEKAQENGLYENFGQREVNAIRNKYVSSADWWGEHYNNLDTYKQALRAVESFDNWASTYSHL